LEVARSLQLEDERSKGVGFAITEESEFDALCGVGNA